MMAPEKAQNMGSPSMDKPVLGQGGRVHRRCSCAGMSQSTSSCPHRWHSAHSHTHPALALPSHPPAPPSCSLYHGLTFPCNGRQLRIQHPNPMGFASFVLPCPTPHHSAIPYPCPQCQALLQQRPLPQRCRGLTCSLSHNGSRHLVGHSLLISFFASLRGRTNVGRITVGSLVRGRGSPPPPPPPLGLPLHMVPKAQPTQG